MVTQEAIIVKHARKRYGKGSHILDGLNMTVSRGTIYGLLGASGCGKTTLLSCIVGIRQLESGSIWVLGGKPGEKCSGIPGPRVGYMPQDVSLVQEFTVMGALYYFGRINGMKESDIEDEYYFLSDLLQLPPKNRWVKNMSGGQQRRVSIAAALLHKPELLILDEPTVGLDPILREKIWNFLVKITQERGTTVVITTHYIEEAKLANKVSLMRGGKLLAEASPNWLLDKYQCSTLEEVFLILAQRQKDNQTGGMGRLSINSGNCDVEDVSTPRVSSQGECLNHNQVEYFVTNEKVPYSDVELTETRLSPRRLCFKRFIALMIKNLTQFIRHPGLIMFAMVFPVVAFYSFFYSVGGDPKGFSIAVINEEAGNCDYGLNKGQITNVNINAKTCEFIDFSCRLLADIDDNFLKKVYYNDTERAKDDAKVGKILGYIHFPQNFSKAIYNRLMIPVFDLKDEDFDSSEITVSLDMGDSQVGSFFKAQLTKKYFETIEETLAKCNVNPKIGDLPVHFEKPIFGEMYPNVTSFMGPVFILTAIFFLTTSVSTSIIIADRHEGVWERSLVQGVSTAEILLAHILTQTLIVILQVTLTLLVCFLQFDLECNGSLALAVAITLLTGFSGLTFGFFVSIHSTSHTTANYITTGSFYPLMILCGCIWPIQGMPEVLKWLSCSLPTTMPGISLRSILDKGKNLYSSEVYSGFLVVSSWCAGLLVLCLISLRSKSK